MASIDEKKKSAEIQNRTYEVEVSDEFPFNRKRLMKNRNKRMSILSKFVRGEAFKRVDS